MKQDKERAELGARLKEAREYRGFSQEETAKYLGVPRSAISLVESGMRRLDVLEFKKLAKLYQCDVNELSGEQRQDLTESEPIKLVARAAATLSETDRSEVLRFVQFLQSRKASEQE